MFKTTTFALNLLLAGTVFAADSDAPLSTPIPAQTTIQRAGDVLQIFQTFVKGSDGSVTLPIPGIPQGKLFNSSHFLAQKYDALRELPVRDIIDLFKGNIKNEVTAFSPESVQSFFGGLHESDTVSQIDTTSNKFTAIKRQSVTFEGVHAVLNESHLALATNHQNYILFLFNPETNGIDADNNGTLYPIITFDKNGDRKVYIIKTLDTKKESTSRPTETTKETPDSALRTRSLSASATPSVAITKPATPPISINRTATPPMPMTSPSPRAESSSPTSDTESLSSSPSSERKLERSTSKKSFRNIFKRSGSTSSGSKTEIVKKDMESTTPPSSGKIEIKKDKKDKMTKKDKDKETRSSSPSKGGLASFASNPELVKKLKEQKAQSSAPQQ